jgi:hypothetical protein
MNLFSLSLCRQESYLIPPASEYRYNWETITKNAVGTVAEMARRATGIHIYLYLHLQNPIRVAQGGLSMYLADLCVSALSRLVHVALAKHAGLV